LRRGAGSVRPARPSARSAHVPSIHVESESFSGAGEEEAESDLRDRTSCAHNSTDCRSML